MSAEECDQELGLRWCSLRQRCIADFDVCDPGLWNTSSCSFHHGGLSWDLSPLQRADHYVVKDVYEHLETRYTLGICRDISPAEVDSSHGHGGQGPDFLLRLSDCTVGASRRRGPPRR